MGKICARYTSQANGWRLSELLSRQCTRPVSFTTIWTCATLLATIQIDFGRCATSDVSCDIMARQEKHFMASLMVQVSSASHSPQSVSTSLALSHICVLVLDQLCLSAGQLTSKMKCVCNSHCQACTMSPRCVEITPKLTTWATEVDNAAGLKQPGERRVVTWHA